MIIMTFCLGTTTIVACIAYLTHIEHLLWLESMISASRISPQEVLLVTL